MIALNENLVNMIIPALLIFIPAGITYLYVGSRSGFIAGALIGTTIGVSANLIDSWVLTILIILTVALLIFENKRSD